MRVARRTDRAEVVPVPNAPAGLLDEMQRADGLVAGLDTNPREHDSAWSCSMPPSEVFWTMSRRPRRLGRAACLPTAHGVAAPQVDDLACAAIQFAPHFLAKGQPMQLTSSLSRLTLVALSSLPLQAQGITEIPAMTVLASHIDMDVVGPAGPTTLAAINAAGSNGGATLANIVLTPSTAALGVYNTNPQGRALGFLQGQLALIDVGGTFDAFDASFELGGPSTQFGLAIGDWVSTMVLDFHLGGTLVVSHVSSSYSTGLGLLKFFQMTGGTFDRVDVRASTTAGNWVVPELWIEAASGLGVNYCMANANSTGASASMSAVGSAAVVANDVVLTASNLPLNAFGFFITSRTQGFVANPGGSAGNLCLGGSIGRYVGPGQIQNSGLIGAISLTLNLTQQPTPAGFVAVQAGETWNFTAWHRDAVGGAATSNFADGLAIAFN
jgi:hypothetical protein